MSNLHRRCSCWHWGACPRKPAVCLQPLWGCRRVRARCEAAGLSTPHTLSDTATPPACVPAQVEEGVKELVRAEKTQKQGRALTCIVALIVLIVVMLVIIIARHI